MKTRRLKKWVKVALTIIIMILGFLIYLLSIKLGELAQEDSKYQLIVALCWSWLLVGQTMVITGVWGGLHENYTN